MQRVPRSYFNLLIYFFNLYFSIFRSVVKDKIHNSIFFQCASNQNTFDIFFSCIKAARLCERNMSEVNVQNTDNRELILKWSPVNCGQRYSFNPCHFCCFSSSVYTTAALPIELKGPTVAEDKTWPYIHFFHTYS